MPSPEDDNGTDYLARHYHIGVNRKHERENAELDGGEACKYRVNVNDTQAQMIANEQALWYEHENERDEIIRRHSTLAQLQPPYRFESELYRQLANAGSQSAVAVKTPEEDRDEEMRRETEEDMMLHPRQRAFMERNMPIEWCHERYPKVYA